MGAMRYDKVFYESWMAFLDGGNCGGAESYAKTFASLYTKTALLGRPGGGTLPPALPAPGLNALAPPPYTIPYIPINNFQSRQNRMEKVLKVYFQVRETLVLNSSMKFVIKNIIAAVKNSILLVKNIKETIATVVQLIKELRALPQKLEAVKDVIIDIVKEEGRQLKSIIDGISINRIGVNTALIEEKFKNEIALYNLIANFKPSAKIQDYFVLVDVISDIDRTLNSLPDIEDGSEEQQIKKFLLNSIKNSISKIVNWGNIFVDPEKAISFVRSYARVDQKFRPVLDILNEFTVLKRILRPQLKKLKIKLKEKIAKLKTKVKDYIQEQKDKLKELIKKKLAKKDNPNKNITFFTKIGKFVKDFKKNNLDRIKKIAKTVNNLVHIIKDVDYIVQKIKGLIEKIKLFVQKGLKEYFDEAIENYRTQYEKFMNDSAAANNAAIDQQTAELRAANNEIDNFLKQLGISKSFLTDIVKKTVDNVKQNQQNIGIPSLQVLNTFLDSKSNQSSEFLDEIITFIDKIIDIDRRVTEIIDDVKKPKDGAKIKDQYVDDGTVYVMRTGPTPTFAQGLIYGAQAATQIGNFVAPPVPMRPVLIRISDISDNTIWSRDSQTNPPDASFKDTTFYYYNNGDIKISEGGSEATAVTIKSSEHVENIDGRLYVAANKPVEIVASKPRPIAPPDYRKKSFLDSLRILLRDIKKRLVKTKQKLKLFLNKVKHKINERVQKIKEGVEDMLINLVPVKSSVRGAMTKKQLLEHRKEKIKSVKTKLRKIVKYISILGNKVVPSLKELFATLVRGHDYRYSVNSKSINNLLDGYYEIKDMDADANTKARHLMESNKIKKDMSDYLGGAEMLYDVFMSFIKDIKDSQFFNKFAKRMEEIFLYGEGRYNLQKYKAFYDKINQIKEMAKGNPSMSDFINFVKGNIAVDPINNTVRLSDPAFEVLKNGYFRSMLSEMERAYLKEFMRTITKVTENPLVKRLFPTKEGEPSLTDKCESAISLVLDIVVKVVYKIYEWIIRQVKRVLKPILDWVKKQKDKLQEDLELWIKEHVVNRMKNFDLKLSAKAYDLAIRVFWLNFKWTAPDSTEFRTISVVGLPSFMFAGITPDDNYSLQYQRLSQSMQIQLVTGYTGICIPNKATGIPPFPFQGYF